jgi:hypothetical protein
MTATVMTMMTETTKQLFYCSATAAAAATAATTTTLYYYYYHQLHNHYDYCCHCNCPEIENSIVECAQLLGSFSHFT